MDRRIRVREVRVIDQDGNQLGVLPTQEALQLAQDAGLNLVEVNAKTAPPVCKILDYGKFKYEVAKRERESKKTRHVQELKEVKFRPKTHDHDFEFKTNHVRRFLEDGDKVKLLIQFRGREITHPETGRAVIDRVVRAVSDLATVSMTAQLEGNRMTMILAPKPARGGGGGGGGPRPASTRADDDGGSSASEAGGGGEGAAASAAPAKAEPAPEPEPTTAGPVGVKAEPESSGPA